ncbi:hypothetical protein Tco_0076211, partial [Tanacetum coccineum]
RYKNKDGMHIPAWMITDKMKQTEHYRMYAEVFGIDFPLTQREKGKLVEETRNSTIPTPIRSPRIHTNLVSSDTEKIQELTDTHTTSSSRQNLLTSNATRASFRSYRDVMVTCSHIYERDKHVKKQVQNQVPVYVAEVLILERQKAKKETERLIAKAILQERRNI